MTLTVGSLFSGIGGIDLGLERAGMRVIWQAETDPYASKVLAKHWPDVPNLGDVTEVDWSGIERPDVIAGGFPCQPVSLAGRGLAQRDGRWLWPEFARCVRSLRPSHVIVENVPGLLVRGMGDVLGDLAEIGYDSEWTGIPAAAVGAPHLRWRIFIVAHAGRSELRHEPVAEPGSDGATVARDDGPERHVGNAEGWPVRPRLCPDESWEILDRSSPDAGGGRRRVGTGDLSGGSRIVPCPCCGEDWCEWHTAHRFDCGCADPWDESDEPDFGWWAAEPDVGRVAHGIPSRVDRLRCLGNAVVPQVAELVGHRLVAHLAA